MDVNGTGSITEEKFSAVISPTFRSASITRKFFHNDKFPYYSIKNIVLLRSDNEVVMNDTGICYT